MIRLCTWPCVCLQDPALSSSSSWNTVRREASVRSWTQTANCPGPEKPACVWMQQKDSTGQSVTTHHNTGSVIVSRMKHENEKLEILNNCVIHNDCEGMRCWPMRAVQIKKEIWWFLHSSQRQWNFGVKFPLVVVLKVVVYTLLKSININQTFISGTESEFLL